MKKLQHQNSCAKTYERPGVSHQSADFPGELPLENTSGMVKSIEGKILLLEERNKSSLNFYEQKIEQLKQVLNRQN